MTVGVAKNVRKMRDVIEELEEPGDLMWAHGFLSGMLDAMEAKIRAKRGEVPSAIDETETKPRGRTNAQDQAARGSEMPETSKI